MKAIQVMVLAVCALAVLGGDVPLARAEDTLKPTYQKQLQDLRRLMDKWEADGMKYEIKLGEQEYSLSKKFDAPTRTTYTHAVTLHAETEQELRRLNLITEGNFRGIIRMQGLVRAYIDDPMYSFDIAVFNGAIETLGVAGCLGTKGKHLDALANKNKDEWGEDEIQRMLASEPKGLHYYEQDVFSCAIPAVFEKEVFGNDKQSEQFRNHLQANIHGKRKELPDYRRDFIRWCRQNNPVQNPYFSAVMMGLFTVDGYSFDDGTGVYTMNGRGRMLMDFVAEFPVPENATRLQAVMDGGNRDEIEAMMRKHGTEGKWRELLQNPAHPEFAQYPQD